MRDEKPIAQKAAALLGQMNLEEKVAQMIQVNYANAGRKEALRWRRRWAAIPAGAA